MSKLHTTKERRPGLATNDEVLHILNEELLQAEMDEEAAEVDADFDDCEEVEVTATEEALERARVENEQL